MFSYDTNPLFSVIASALDTFHMFHNIESFKMDEVVIEFLYDDDHWFSYIVEFHATTK